MLTTSREPLGVPGERRFAVPPLGAEAALLFAERAVAVRSDFRAGEHEAAIQEICERLDGIPLAIELAAARVAHLSPREIAVRLGRSFELLASRERGERRHATLRATLDWSHELLEEPERILLRRLAVFCDPFTLDAAESVCAAPPLAPDEVLDLLASLVRRSLVEPREQGGETRYRLLETVRAYAREKLAEAGESDALSTRHADWMLAWLRRSLPQTFGSMFPILAVEELTRSIGDVSAACEWSLARADVARAPELIARASPLFIPLSRAGEALSAVERALALPGGDPEWRLGLRHGLGRILTLMGRFADSFRVLETLLPELEAGGHHASLASALTGLSIASEVSGLGDPLALLERSIEAARAAADPLLEADALVICGEHELTAGRLAEAVAELRPRRSTQRGRRVAFPQRGLPSSTRRRAVRQLRSRRRARAQGPLRRVARARRRPVLDQRAQRLPARERGGRGARRNRRADPRGDRAPAPAACTARRRGPAGGARWRRLPDRRLRACRAPARRGEERVRCARLLAHERGRRDLPALRRAGAPRAARPTWRSARATRAVR